jgi:large subunit ribosomal protein L24
MGHRIRRGDTVAVIAGDDKGRRGKVLRLVLEKDRVVVEGVNLVYKHLRKSQANPNGGRIRREAALHISNVMPIDPDTNKPTKVASKVVAGKRVRVGRVSGAELGGGSVKAPDKKASGKKAAPASGKGA